MNDTIQLERHFSFGENWARFAPKIDAARIHEAQESLIRLVGREVIQGSSFLDIGSGSGLFSVAAMRLGCRRLLAVDIDPKCVAATRATLEAHAGRGAWACQCISVFEFDPVKCGTFDVVYAWGVLHHTGAMRDAICRAAQLVSPGGRLILGLYQKTPFCNFWRIEKRFYSQASGRVQTGVRALWLALLGIRLALRGQTLRTYVKNYNPRGMDLYYDVHDWLGGYPYESISADELEDRMHGLGFRTLRSFRRPCLGLLGQGCAEYCFARESQGAAALRDKL